MVHDALDSPARGAGNPNCHGQCFFCCPARSCWTLSELRSRCSLLSPSKGRSIVCLDVPMIRELMAGSYQGAGGRSFRWSLLSPSRGTEQRVFRRTYVRDSIPIDKASLRASCPKTTSLFLQLSLCVCPSRTQCWCSLICVEVLE